MQISLEKKVVFITGANGAMAQETIKALIRSGIRHIMMAVRTKEKGEAAKAKIIQELPLAKEARLEVIPGFDMNEPVAISHAVSRMANQKIDIVFLAAGFAVFTDDYQTVQYKGHRIEKNIFQNLMGSHFTLEQLKKHSLLTPHARVVIAGGEGARGIKGLIAQPNFKDIQTLKDYTYLKDTPKYNPMNAIGVSKLAGALWTKKMAELHAHEHSTVWFSPGLTSGSAGLQTLPPLKRWFMNKVLFGIISFLGKAQSPAQGGQKYADALLGKVGRNGELIGAPEGQAIGAFTEQTPMNPILGDPSFIDGFWDIIQEVFEEEEVVSQAS